jgi:hypothetical protein
VAQIGHHLGTEVALAPLDRQAVLTKMKQNSPDVLHMAAPGGAEDQNIVEEHEHEDAEEALQDVVHECLECGRRICEAKWHH